MSDVMMDTEGEKITLGLSVSGLAGWHMYRTGLHPTLVAEMFPPVTSHDDFMEGIEAIFKACAFTTVFPDLPALAAPVEKFFAYSSTAYRNAFTMGRWVDTRFFMRLMFAPFDDKRIKLLTEFYGAILDVPYTDPDDYPPDYVLGLQRLWFTYCDAALAIATEEGLV